MILGKKIGAAVLSFALVLSLLVLPAGAAGEIGVTIDGTSVLYDDGYGRPFLDSAGRTQVPFRLTMESFGCAVYWNNETRTAVAEKDGTRVEVPIGAPYLLVNGKRVEMDTTAQIVDTRTYLPIRPVMEAFGAYVTWDNANRLVVIKTGSSLLRVHFLDVGQGDCILIDCGETEVLIDGGNNGAGDEVVSYLTPYIDGKLDYLIATHPDADHVGGLDAVLEAFEVGEVIDSGRKSDTDTYKDYWAAVQAEGCTISYGEDRIIPLSSLAALSILETGNDWEDSNDCSVVAQLTCGNVQVLFTGDMSQQVETKLLPLFGDIDVLKVSHHGSDTASCAEFLSVVKPEYAVISYGLDNAYHHPAGESVIFEYYLVNDSGARLPEADAVTRGYIAQKVVNFFVCFGCRSNVLLCSFVRLYQVVTVHGGGNSHFFFSCIHELKQCHLGSRVLHSDAVGTEIYVVFTPLVVFQIALIEQMGIQNLLG